MILKAFAAPKVCVADLEGHFSAPENRRVLAPGHPGEENREKGDQKISRVSVQVAKVKANLFLHLCSVALDKGSTTFPFLCPLCASVSSHIKWGNNISGHSTADVPVTKLMHVKLSLYPQEALSEGQLPLMVFSPPKATHPPSAPSQSPLLRLDDCMSLTRRLPQGVFP